MIPIRPLALVWTVWLAAACGEVSVGAETETDSASVDTVRLRCEGGPILRPALREPAGSPAVRLLVAENDLLMVREDGSLLRFEPGGTMPGTLLDAGARDYDARGDLLVRLETDRLALFRYRADRVPIRIGELPAARHESGVALSDRAVYVHSVLDPGGHRVIERDRRSGDTTGKHLALERDLLQLVVGGQDRILEDLGDVRVLGRGFALVPWVRDPIEIVQGGARTSLYLGSGRRGRIRTVAERRTPISVPCPVCPRRQEIATRQEVRRLYAAAIAADGVLWVVRLEQDGGFAALLRYEHSGGEPVASSWRIPAGGGPPRAMAIWRGRLAISHEDELRFYDMAAMGRGRGCRLE